MSLQSSVPVADVNGPVMRRLRAAASDNNITLVIGVIERCDVQASGPPRSKYGSMARGGFGTLYCAPILRRSYFSTTVLTDLHGSKVPH
jgi:hypothetical protein